MFSSDPVSGHGAGAAGMHAAFVDDVFVAEVFPSVDDASRAASWMPDDIGLVPFRSPDDADASAPDATSQTVHEAVAHALAAREEEEAVRREQLQAEAYAAGVDAGRAEAEAAGHAALTSAIEALWIAAEEVRAGESRWLAALEDNVAALVAAAARHVVVREVSADDALVREVATRAVAEYPQDHPLHVRVNPADLATLKSMFAAAPRAGEIRWTADARVQRGGCVVEGRERIVDGRVDTALERIYRTLGRHHA